MSRKKVTVVGGGFVGSTTAQRIVDLELADVVLTDIWRERLREKLWTWWKAVQSRGPIRSRREFRRRREITARRQEATWW